MNNQCEAENPSFPKFLELLSSDQRRILVSTLVDAVELTALNKILAEESVEAQKYYARLEKFSKRQEVGSISKSGTNATSIDDIVSDSEKDDSDDEDPKKWTPTVKDDFFEKFPVIMNILILGETGVGKSTFINGLANYLRFNNIYEAKDRFEILIKAHFTVSDSDYNQFRIECEPTIPLQCHGDNEVTEVGQSSTQSPKSYLISWGPPERRMTIRIIDTPGIGDSRGIEQDKENFAKTLNFIAQFKELHAICILMKPNESKLSLTYRFCINELLTHLHVSASKNILFCFTNARQTLYNPGETLPTLKAYLSKLQNIEIPLDRSTVFCFDNESFRSLCAWREGINFTENEIIDFNTSWKITIQEMFRLFQRISELPVHRVEDTVSINNVRSVILTMAKPLVEISKNQLINMQLIDKKMKEIQECIADGKDLDNKLFIDQVEPVVEELSSPMTVCSSETCVTQRRLANRLDIPVKIDYTQICHNPCSVDGIPTESCPNEQLKGCFVFQKSADHKCSKCGCSWDVHIHLRYKIDLVLKKIVDPAVEESMKQFGNKQEAAKLFLHRLKQKKEKLEKEIKIVNNHCAEFAIFLRKNSLLPYNDAYKEYADHSIKEEEMKVAEGGSPEHLQVLQSNKESYVAQAEVIESAQKYTATVAKSAAQIKVMVEELKKLETCGKVLEEVQKLVLISMEKQQREEPVVVRTKGGWFEKKFGFSFEGIKSVRRTTFFSPFLSNLSNISKFFK